MMKKNKEKKAVEPEIGENLGNPFADLKVDVPEPVEPPPPPPPPPPTKEEKMEAELSAADKRLLEAFRARGSFPASIGHDKPATAAAPGPRLTYAIQKKGHKGRVVTLVNGFKELTMGERMELCNKIKVALGIGARFVDYTLELQGDQRERASAWFEKVEW